jgi:2-keto-3-deoxy-L-rhamnonate aldolase RhmA
MGRTMYRLLEKLDGGQAALGLLQQAGADLIPYAAKAGADFVIIDMMMGPLGFAEASTLCWVARAESVYPFVRLSSHPWGAGGVRTDHHLPASAAKALSSGAEGVIWSISSVDEAVDIAHLQADWHQPQPVLSTQEMASVTTRNVGTRLLLPMVESVPMLDRIEEILAVDGISGVFLGMTDLSSQLGRPYNYDDPVILSALRRAVDAATASGKFVAANTGYLSSSPDEQLVRVRKLQDAGVRMIMTQTAKFLMYTALKSIIDSFGEGVPQSE